MSRKTKDIVLSVILAFIFILFISRLSFITTKLYSESQQDRIEQKLDQLLEKANVQSQ